MYVSSDAVYSDIKEKLTKHQNLPDSLHGKCILKEKKS